MVCVECHGQGQSQDWGANQIGKGRKGKGDYPPYQGRGGLSTSRLPGAARTGQGKGEDTETEARAHETD
eukprot:4947325-Heterocapsa_arctica.AAC.1